MQTLNLAYVDRSDIKYEIINFPDGHKHLKILSVKDALDFDLRIISRFRNMDDLFLIAQAMQILCGYEVKTLELPYLFGARCDRKFSNGEANDALIIAHNICNIFPWYDRVRVYDVHSNLDRYKNVQCQQLEDIFLLNSKLSNTFVCYPDQSAYEKYSQKVPGIQAFKHRDGNGNIDSYNLQNLMVSLKDCNILVRDDLIDGGATFIELARLLKQEGAANLYLYVTHGIFSKGFDEVIKYYNHIWCTNSYADLDWPEQITCYDVYD